MDFQKNNELTNMYTLDLNNKELLEINGGESLFHDIGVSLGNLWCQAKSAARALGTAIAKSQYDAQIAGAHH